MQNGKTMRNIYTHSNQVPAKGKPPSKSPKRKSLKAGNQDTDEAGMLLPQQINVHQHFDQANILNVN